MKTLYLTDLDGTLLRFDESISEFSLSTINQFMENGGLFSYATGRSYATSAKVAAKLKIEIPVICQNGRTIVDNLTGKSLLAHNFEPQDARDILSMILSHNIPPVVFSYINGAERFSYVSGNINRGMSFWQDRRGHDTRRRPVDCQSELYFGDIIYFVCIGDLELASFINNIFKDDERIHTILHKDNYTEAWWCEILPAPAKKSIAALELKNKLGCDKLVVFGDGQNDLCMFRIADESYATANAVPELKEIATNIIGSNETDAVAKWLAKEANYGKK
jgi:Cof subfamily protein (haloacid dehalogenase superfamily)